MQLLAALHTQRPGQGPHRGLTKLQLDLLQPLFQHQARAVRASTLHCCAALLPAADPGCLGATASYHSTCCHCVMA